MTRAYEGRFGEPGGEGGSDAAGTRVPPSCGWYPAGVANFAGALRYTRYGFFKRLLMRSIARKEGSPDLDARRDYEYTDWSAVNGFVEDFVRSLEEGEEA